MKNVLRIIGILLLFVVPADAINSIKTVEFPFPTNTTALLADTRYDFAAITLNIPEITSRTFKSVIVQVDTCDTSVAATSITSWLIGIKLGAAAFSDATVTDTITNSGENQCFRFSKEVTSYFNSSFGAAASQTSQVGVQFGAIGTINTSAKLIVTFEYDGAAQATQVKTARIPLENDLAGLGITLDELGVNQVPNLNTMLGETSITYRHIWFEILHFQSRTGTTDFTTCYALDAEAEVCSGIYEHGLQSAIPLRFLWVRNDMTTNAVHAFKSRTTVATTVTSPTVVLNVTYTYDSTASIIHNSIMLSWNAGSNPIGTDSTNPTRVQLKFFVEEPATITLKQSGVYIKYTGISSDTLLKVLVGSQLERSYVQDTGVDQGGTLGLIQRIDSGGAQGAGMTLARGENTITIELYSTSTDELPSVSGVVFLNYTSGKAPGCGADGHARTIIYNIMDTAADAAVIDSASLAPSIPESVYYINNLGYEINSIKPVILDFFDIQTEVKTGEQFSKGWLLTGAPWTTRSVQPSKVGLNNYNVDMSEYWQKYPADPGKIYYGGTKLAVETSRIYRVQSYDNSWTSAYLNFTMHNITFTSTKPLTGYTGDGSGISVQIFRSDTHEYLTTVTSAVGGNFTIVWYDNTLNIYSVARQDDTHTGRSANFLAGT